MNGYRLKHFRVNHNVLCYGYTLEIDRAGKFDAQRAKEKKIPLEYWSRLQAGEQIETEDGVFTPGHGARSFEKRSETDLYNGYQTNGFYPEIMLLDPTFLSVRGCTVKRKKRRKRKNINI